MAKIVMVEEYEEWRDRATEEVAERLAQVRTLSRQEYATSAPGIISEITRELVELALRAEAINARSRPRPE